MTPINETILKRSKNSLLTKENNFVDNILNKHKVKFTKNFNGEYDIEGDFYLGKFPELITNGKLNIKFGKVIGEFSCYKCENLTSFEGCPREVSGDFHCNYCGTKFTEDDVKEHCKVHGEIIV